MADHTDRDVLVKSGSHDEDSTDISSSSTSATSISSHTNFCRVPVSPWPVIVTCMLFLVPIAINSTSLDTLLYNKLCYQRFHDLQLCSNKTFTTTHPDLQKEQAEWSNYVSVLSLPLAILTNLMLSSYCDKVGHKVPLVLPILGTVISSFYLALIATTDLLSWPMATVLVFPILNTMFGGFPMVIMAVFSYVALVTTPEKRAFYMALSEASLVIGVLIGTLVNGFIIDDLGLDTLAYITAGISVIPMIVSIAFVTDVTSTSHTSSWRDMIGTSHFLDAFKTLYKKREGYSRLLLNLCFLIYSLLFVGTVMYMGGSYLYFVKERGLTMTEYSLFSAYVNVMKGFGGPSLVYVINRVFKPDEFHFAAGCGVSMVIGFIIMSIDAIPHSMWIGGAFMMTQTTFYAIIRDNQTKICSKEELGKLFAFDAIIQVIMTCVTAIVAKEVYTWSLTFWPGLFLALCAFLTICAMVVLNIFTFIHDKDTMIKASKVGGEESISSDNSINSISQ